MTHFQYLLIYYTGLAFEALTVAFGLWRGDRTVRLITAAYAIPAAALLVLHHSGAPAARYWGYGETLSLIGYLAVTLRRGSQAWLLCLCAFQIADVGTYVARLLAPSIGSLALLTAVNTWSYLATASLLWGAVEAHRARGRAASAQAA